MRFRKKCQFLRSLIFCFGLAIPFFSQGKALYSVDLQKRLNDPASKKTQKIRVLVQFNSDQFVDSSDIGQSYEVRFQQNLVRNTLRLEKQILTQINANRQVTDAFSLWLVQGSFLTLTMEQVRSLGRLNSISHVTWLNRRGRIIQSIGPEKFHQTPISPLRKYTYGLEKIKVPELLSIYPELTGSGTTVGIIDTGVDANHPDLRGKVIRFRDFTNPANKNPIDDHGHGSHVAGTIAGGEASGGAIGVAPETKLIIAKTFTRTGSSVDENLLKSLQWMADPDEVAETNDRPQIISNSWELDDSPYADLTPEDEPFCVAIKSLSELGVVSVFAAGNNGSGASTIQTPASCPQAISVGATDRNDQLTSFSSRGPVRWKNQTLIKPEVSAPGKDIDSADPGGGYRTRSGTSMATPHVAGVLAVMQQLNLDLKLNQLTQYLFDGAKDLGTPAKDNLYGFGRVDILQSIYLMKTASEKVRAGKIIGEDDLITVRSDNSNIPEKFRDLVEAIGWTNYGCTVTHIGNGYALTAGHCFEATAQLQRDKGCSYAHVEWGYRQGKNPSLRSDCEKIVALQNDLGESDFAILKMKTYPSAVAVLKKDDRIYPRQMMTIFSHPNGQPLRWSQYCFVSGDHDLQVAPGLLEYTCDTDGGSSGAVLLDAETAQVAGIHKGGFPQTNYGSHLLQSPLMTILAELGF
jgi:subtilisin family serine protease